MQQEIAEADYGYGMEKHLNVLKNILPTGVLPKRFEWEPMESLSLISWETYFKEDVKTVNMVFFCCVVLLASEENSKSAELLDGQVEKLIIAIDCANILGLKQVRYLYELCVYLVSKTNIQNSEEDFLYFNLSLYILAVMLKSTQDELQILITSTIEAEKQVVDYCQYDLNKNIFKYTFFDQRILVWREDYSKYGVLLEQRRKNQFSSLWKTK